MTYDHLPNVGAARPASGKHDYASRFWRSHDTGEARGDVEARLRRKMIGLIVLMLVVWALATTVLIWAPV